MKKMVYIIVIIFLFFIFSSVMNADSFSNHDPLLAGVLSWYMAGLGQFYNGQYLKGSIFWVVDNTLLISTILTVADINFSVNKDIGFQVNIKPKEKITSTSQNIALSLLLTYTAFHIYNVIDAISFVKHRYNTSRKESSRKIFFDYRYVFNNNYFGFNYKL